MIWLHGCRRTIKSSPFVLHMLWKLVGLLCQVGEVGVRSLRVQERVKVFLWELTHSNLLTNEARWKRGLALNADCT